MKTNESPELRNILQMRNPQPMDNLVVPYPLVVSKTMSLGGEDRFEIKTLGYRPSSFEAKIDKLPPFTQ